MDGKMDRSLDLIKARLDQVVMNQSCEPIGEDEVLGEYRELVQTINKLIVDVAEARTLTNDLSAGKLDGLVPGRRNYLAAPLKNLQSQLSILEYNANQLASGKIVSKLEQPGQLPQAFNKIIDYLIELTSETKLDVISDLASLSGTSSWRFHQILLALNKIHAIIIETNSVGKVVYANHTAWDFLDGVETIDIEGAEKTESDVIAYLAYYARQGLTFPAYREIYDNKRDQWYKITTDQFTLAENQVFFVHVIDNITEWKRHEEQLENSANYDAMTETFNLRAGLDQLRRSLKRSRPDDEHCLVFVDLDNLKETNDTYGHLEGDYFIRTVAQILLGSVRHYDIVSRYGGDEFFIFFRNCNQEDAEKRMQFICNKLQEYNNRGERPYKMEFSFGIYAFRYNQDLNVTDLIDSADRRMYKNKKEKQTNRPAK